MGKLIEQTIPALHGGVSRQPPSVRRPEQVEAGDNALFSVVSGGFTKRPPTQHIAKPTFVSTGKDYAFHSIDRTLTEQYFVLIDISGLGAGGVEIKVMDSITGTQNTVTVADSTKYFLVEQDGIDSVAIIDDSDANDIIIPCSFATGETQFDWEFTLSDASTVFKIEGSADNSTWNDIATGKTGASGSFSTTVGAVTANDHNYIRVTTTTGAGTSTDTITLKATFQDTSYLSNPVTVGSVPPSASLRFATIADTTVICNVNTVTRMAEADTGTITSSVQTFGDLPAAAADNSIHYVVGDDTDGFGSYYVKDVTGPLYEEVADPTAHNNFDASTLPHLLSRNSDDTFTFKQATWGARTAGDEESIPEPDWIGLTINDVTFYRNRLALVADEVNYCSRAGDLFEMFPKKATQVLDDDPVSRAASSTEINILEWVTVYRKIMFATSRRAQFETTSNGAFTPESAEMDLATAYNASSTVKPHVVGDMLYFAGIGLNYSVIYEYGFNEASLSNQATDITKHVADYVPDNMKLIAGDASSGTVFFLSSDEENSLYVYRTFFDGNDKLQSAWSRYIFGDTESDAKIIGMDVIDGYLALILEREDGFVHLEQMPVELESPDPVMNFMPLIDQREIVLGTYDATTEATSWDISWEHNGDASIVTDDGHGSNSGQNLPTFYPSRYTLTLATVAAAETIVINGLTFTAHATTTTTANREFSISGNDVADAGELTTCINDGTDGVPNVTATDNGDGTITLNMDDPAQDDGITAPTGTAIDNATITADLLKDIVGANGDWSASSAYIGRDYETSVELSEIFVKKTDTEAASPSIITGRLALKDITFNLEETGYMTCEVAKDARPTETFTFSGQILGDTAAVGTREMASTYWKVPIWANAQHVTITVKNDSPFPSTVASAAWRGFFSEVSRGE